MRNKLLYISAVSLLAAPGLFAQTDSSRYKVTVVGQAPADLPRAREAAVEDALRQAVEAGAGVLIASETKVENFQLIKDVIYTKSAGLVETYKVLRENPNQQGLYAVRIEAIVSRGTLNTQLEAWKTLIRRKGWPRLMVVGSVDKRPFDMLLTARVQGLMERRGLTVVDWTVLNENQRRAAERAAISDGDLVKAALISQEIGADYLVIAGIDGTELPAEKTFGVKLYPADATGMFKVVAADTARVIASEVLSRQSKAQSAREAIRDVTNTVLEQTFEEAIKRVAVHWLEDVDPRGGQQIQLVLHKFPFDRMNHLLLNLRQAGGARETVVDSTDAKGRSQVRLITNQAALNIAAVLLKIDPGIRITKSSKYSIEVEAITEEWTPLSAPIEKLRDSWAPPAQETTSGRIEEAGEVEELEGDGSSVPGDVSTTVIKPPPRPSKVERASIAVMEFQVMGKIPTGGKDAGRILSDAMISEIDSARFDIYERSQLKSLLQEKGFQESVLIGSPSRAAQFGKLAGVRYVVLGSLGRLGSQYHLSSRVVDCQSGKITDRGWVSFMSINDWPAKIPELVNLVGLRRGSGGGGGSGKRFLTGNDLIDSVNWAADFTVEVGTVGDRQTYIEGEGIRFTVKVSRNCFVTLITVDSKGSMTLLLPNAWQRRAFVRRGEVMVIPSSEAGFRFPIKPPHGETLVKAIATLKPLRLSGVNPERIEEQKFAVMLPNTKGIGLEGDPERVIPPGAGLNEWLQPTEWSTAELVVITQAKDEFP